MEDAGLTLVGHSSLKAALDLDWGSPALPRAGLGPGGGGTGGNAGWSSSTPWRLRHLLCRRSWRPSRSLSCRTPSQTWGGPGGRRIKQHVAPDRRILSRSQTCATVAKAVPKPSTVLKSTLPWIWIAPSPGEVVVRPANEPEHEAVELLAEELRKPLACCKPDIDLGYMASPRIAQGAEQGVYIIARP